MVVLDAIVGSQHHPQRSQDRCKYVGGELLCLEASYDLQCVPALQAKDALLFLDEPALTAISMRT